MEYVFQIHTQLRHLEERMLNMDRWNHLDAFLHYECAFVCYLCFHSAGFSTYESKNISFQVHFDCHRCTSDMSLQRVLLSIYRYTYMYVQ